MDANDRAGTLLEALLERIAPIETAASLIITISLTVLVILVGLTIARIVKGRLLRLVARTRTRKNLALLLGNVAFFTVIALTVLILLSLHGLDSSVIVAVLGAGSVAIALSLQDILKNIISGVYLLLEEPFNVGDTLVVDGREGEVEAMDLRTTLLRLSDGTQARIPNTTVFTSTVVSHTAHPLRRTGIRLSGQIDLDGIEQRVREAVFGQPGIAIAPAPQLRIDAIGREQVTLTVLLWRKADHELDPGVLIALKRALPEAEISRAT